MIHVDSRLLPPPIASELIERAAGAVLAHAAVVGDLTVVLAENKQLHQLNRDYLGVDAPTDVLAFPGGEIDPESGAKYLGDILISVPQAESQARAAGHPLQSEIQLLVVHGALHLLGYDHAQPDARSRMWAVQDEILASIGLPEIVIRDS